MSLATLDVPSNRLTTGNVPGGNPETSPRLRAVPQGTEARGFVLYVGLGEAKAADAAETARKATVLAAFLTAAALLVAAVGAYWAAMKGGRHRDDNTVFSGIFGRF